MSAGEEAGEQDASAQTGVPPGGDYNLLPYLSLPIAYTQPARLAALAALFGLEAPAADRARVLELGCASGGNIIPLAARFPNARFLGIDLAQRHIDEGRQRIGALGLANVELRQGDLTRISLGGEQFDYAICHGVFSWVPKAAQDAILRICGDALAANGMAALSYNVLPGWHLRKVVRDICLHHAGKEGAPRDRVARARSALEQIARSSSAAEPYGLLLRNEARRAARRPASYILGEFLAEHNAPCYFHELIDWAGQHGLSYLCEGDLAASVPEVLNPATAKRIRAMAGTGHSGFEQYVDFFTGRTFRRSVLIKARQAAAIQRARNPDRLRGLHFASPLRLDPSRSTEQLSVYKDARGRAIRARDPAVRRALARLAEHYPTTLALEQLVARAAQDEGRADSQARVCNALFRMVAAGQATVSVLPLQAGRAADERPRAWPLARAEAARGQPWVTSLQHAPATLQPVSAFLLAHLDGGNDRQKLKTLLAGALRRGEVRVPELQTDGARIQEGQLETIAAQCVERALSELALNAVLEPPP